MLFAVERDIDAQKSDEELKSWMICFRTVAFQFKKLPSVDDKYFEAFNLREALMHQAQHLQHTAIQKVTSLMAFAHRKNQTTGRLTNKDLAKLFEDQATYATGSEKFTETFIKAASTVWERLLTPPGPRAVLMALDDAYGLANPLNS
eukprot:9482009-Pyramimonas_sp.AAC.1